MDVRKSDNSLQAFEADKIIVSCMTAGVSSVFASEIASTISQEISDATSTSDIRAMVYEKLKKINPDIAEKYMYRLSLRVRTSKILLETFDIEKIVSSLMTETDIDRTHATKIAKDVEKELSRLKLKYVTAPLIREIVNVKLLESGFENTRARYTRLGMPVHDVTDLIMNGTGKKQVQQYNPDTLQRLMAEQMIREYTLLNVLPPVLADAHMDGQIHIHDIGYFPIRTYSFSHDLRFFLKNGFKADGVGKYSATSGPVKNPEVAFLQSAKILGAAQTNCGGGQGLNYFNTFLAPYVSGLSFDDIIQLAQIFVYELSQTYSTAGLFSCIQCNFSIPKQLRGLPAVLPGGVSKKTVTYADFADEAQSLLRALVHVYLRGDSKRKGFNMPKLELQISDDDMSNPLMVDIAKLSSKYFTPSFTIRQKYMSNFNCYQNSAYLMPLAIPLIRRDTLTGFLRGGCAQMVTLNLPQIALESDGNENKLYKLLAARMSKAKNILLLKRQILEKNMQNNLMPFFSQKVDKRGSWYLEPGKQSYLIGFAGLDDMVRISTGQDMGSTEGLKYGLKIIRKMSQIVGSFVRESALTLALAESPEGSHNQRLWDVDSLRYANKIEKLGLNFDAYSRAYHLRRKSSLKKMISVESEFHPYLNGGATLDVPILRGHSAGKVLRLIKKMVDASGAQHFRFVEH